MKEPTKLLNDILSAIEIIQSYEIVSYEQLVNDEKTQDAIMFRLIIIGEAANQISNDFQEKHPELPWSSIIGTRNVIVHGYDQIKLQIVWDIIQKNLPELKHQLESIFH